MRYRKLGKTGLDVSEIALGGWLTIGGSVAETDAVKTIHHAFDKGITLFDTAEVYAEGQSEMVFGKALAQLPREEVIIATKARGRWKGGRNREGFSRKHLFEAVHASLKRLHLDYVDLYQLHWFDPETPLEETMTALNDLVRQGKVLYIGCSNFSTEQLRDALAICDARHLERFVSIQPPYNMFLRKIEETLLPRCAVEGIGAIVYSPLAQGVLTGKYRAGKPYPAGSRAAQYEQFVTRYLTPQHFEAVRKLEKIAQRKRKTLAQMALAWVLRRGEVSSAIVGASSIKQLDENIKGSGWKISANDLKEIDDVLPELPPSPK